MEKPLNTDQIDTEVFLSDRASGILWIIFFIYLFMLGWIIQYYEHQTTKTFISVLLAYNPEIMGTGFGFGIIPIIIAFVRKFRRKRRTKGIFIIYFIISTINFFMKLHLVIISNSI